MLTALGESCNGVIVREFTFMLVLLPIPCVHKFISVICRIRQQRVSWLHYDRLLTKQLILRGFYLKFEFHKYYHLYNDRIFKYNLPVGRTLLDCLVQLFGRSLHTESDYGLLHFYDECIVTTAGVTSQQGCLLIQSTWFHLWCFYESVLALILILYSFWDWWDWFLFVTFTFYTVNQIYTHWIPSYTTLTMKSISYWSKCLLCSIQWFK